MGSSGKGGAASHGKAKGGCLPERCCLQLRKRQRTEDVAGAPGDLGAPHRSLWLLSSLKGPSEGRSLFPNQGFSHKQALFICSMRRICVPGELSRRAEVSSSLLPRTLPGPSCGTEREEETDSRGRDRSQSPPHGALCPSSPLPSGGTQIPASPWRPSADLHPQRAPFPRPSSVSPGCAGGSAHLPPWTAAWSLGPAGSPSHLQSGPGDLSSVLPREARRRSGLSPGEAGDGRPSSFCPVEETTTPAGYCGSWVMCSAPLAAAEP